MANNVYKLMKTKSVKGTSYFYDITQSHMEYVQSSFLKNYHKSFIRYKCILSKILFIMLQFDI